MPLRGRHSLNFDFFPVVHWAVILVPVDPILLQLLGLEKVVPTCPLIDSLNCLSFHSKICAVQPHFSAISQSVLQSKIGHPLTSK